MTRVLVCGASGQLGQCLSTSISESIDAVFLGREEFNLSDSATIQSRVAELKPTFIVNCAAYTNVDGAESDREGAFAVNQKGVADLANICAELGIKLIHISTDFVFDGRKQSPYVPTDECAPVGIYGTSKYQGEIAVLNALPSSAMVIRTSWLYSEFGGNFVKTMLRLHETKDEFQVVEDQKGSPTYALGLAQLVWHILETDNLIPGVFHWSDSGVTSWFEFAQEIGDQGHSLGLIDRKALVKPILAKEYGSVAPRPAYSALDCGATANAYPQIERQPWRVNLRQMLQNLGSIEG